MTHHAGKAAGFVALFAAMAMLLTAMATVSAADDIATGVGSNTGSSLPLRSETTTSSSAVTPLDKSSAAADDVAIDDGSNTSFSLPLSSETAASSAATQLKSSAATDDIAIGVGCITGSSLRLRSEASTSSSVVTQLDKSTAVAILGKQDGWYYISYDGKSGYVSAEYVIEDQDGVFTTDGRVNGDGVNVRASATSDAESVATVDSGSPVTVNGFADGWYAVTCQYGTTGYIRSDFVDLTSADSTSSSTSVSGVVSVAKQYLGTRYIYGGASPSGFDCSGFTMYVFKQMGVSLPHSATSQWQSEAGQKITSTSALQSGDLVFFCDPSRSLGKACSHAGIYIGSGRFIHASSANSGGVIISSLSSGYYNTYFVGGMRI